MIIILTEIDYPNSSHKICVYFWMKQTTAPFTSQIFAKLITPYEASLATCGEANQVGAQTEAGTLARRNADARADGVKDSEHHRGEHGQSGNLLHRQSLLGDVDSCRSNH